MHLNLVVTAIDSALGRLDYDSLSDQALMELLIDGIGDEDKEYFRDSNCDFLDIEEWDGLEFNSDGKVEKIEMSFAVEASLAFDFVPKSVKKIDFFDCLLTGSVETSLLPDGLEHFKVSETRSLSGTFDFAKLPSHLVTCDICENSFLGTADFTKLPVGLTKLELHANNFSGTLSFASLPEGLGLLSLDHNGFYGSLDFAALPRCMHEFSASDNNFSGTVDWQNLPPGLDFLWLQKNKFTGELRLKKNCEKLMDVDVSNNLFEEEAIVHSCLHEFIVLGGNKIEMVFDESGELCVSSDDGKYVESL